MRYELMPKPGTYRETQRNARRAHRCEAFCGYPIDPRNHYIEVTGVWDGGWERFSMHRSCMELYRYVTDGYNDDLAFCETLDGAMDALLLSPWQPRVEASEEAA